jgi:hypothetical protein
MLRYVAALALSVALNALPARAATMDLFTFSSPQITGAVTASIDASPVPSSSISGVSFTLSSVSASFEGTTFTGPVTFLNAGGAAGGGVTFGGPVLFSGSDAAPTFLLGSFTLSGVADLGNGGPENVTGLLTISQPGAVPEPLPLALTGTGIFTLVAILRRRHTELRSADISC